MALLLLSPRGSFKPRWAAIDVAKATEIGSMSDALFVKLVALADLYVAASKFKG